MDRRGPVGLAAAVVGPPASAQTLEVMRGAPASDLDVPINSAVVVESDVPLRRAFDREPRDRRHLLAVRPDDLCTGQDAWPDDADSARPGGTAHHQRRRGGDAGHHRVQGTAAPDPADRVDRGAHRERTGGSGTLTGTPFGPDGGTGFNRDPEAFGSIGIAFDVGDLTFQLLLQALEAKGLVRTLSEPNLTALSGQEATFLAGGEYPIPIIDHEGGVFIEYKPFGVQLTFTPRVVDNERINLQLAAAVSGIDATVTFQTGGFAINSFRRRETSTTVEVRDGESFAIAGLLEDDFRDLVGQVPWLGEIPVLGALFRSSDYERQQSELVIIVTPHLVRPVPTGALALPTDRIRPPTENELFLLGRTGAPALSGGAGEVARQDFTGSCGYVME